MLETRCLLFWCAAFFPAPDDNEIEYYEALGVAPSATKEEIRKAYKKKSLALHPDKIQQRGGDASDSAYRKQFQAIQEAHTVLSDDKKRKMYDLLNRSPTRFKFLNDDGALASSYDNLAKSSCGKKSRLVLLLVIILAFLLAAPILVCVKINHELEGGAFENTPWIVILIPWWILCCLYLGGVIYLSLLMGCMSVVFCKVIETMSWIVGQVLLALRWDLTVTADYALVFIPFYVALGLRWLGLLLTMRQMSHNIRHMITIEKLEGVLGKSYQDLTEEEQDDLAKEYIIVHVLPDAYTMEGTDDDRIKSSPEFQMAMHAYYNSFLDMFKGMLFGIPFIVLLVLKLDENLPASWWAVFAPVWAYLGLPLLFNCYSCCCVAESEEILIIAPDENRTDDPPADDSADKKASASSADFVMPSSSISEFNKSTAPPENLETQDKKTQAMGESSTSTAPSTAQPMKSAATTSSTTPDKNVGKEADTSEEPPYYEMDEETFNNMHEAFQQAEANAMEAQSKAAGNVFTLLFQIMMVALVVGKLQDDVPPDGNIGYNALWIIFPILVLAGCMCCCWGCLIYGAGAQGVDELVKRATPQAGSDSAADDAAKDEEAPPVVIPPPLSPMDASPAQQDEEADPPSRASSKEAVSPVQSNGTTGGFDADELD